MPDLFELTPEQKNYRDHYPQLFDDGARLAYFGESKGEREPGDYPKGFHTLPLEARNAWWAGFNKGRCDSLQKKGARR
jgi:hypothetical protein